MSSNPPREGCCTKVTLHSGRPTGSIKKLGNLNCYLTSNYTQDSKKFVFIFPDIYGINLINTQLVADKLSTCLNYPVILIDILNNDPFDVNNGDFQSWFANHPPELTISLLKEFFKFFKSTHLNTNYLAGIGYCFGAKYLSHYLTEDGILDVGAFAHPSFVSDDELNAIKKPLILSCAETDTIFTRELRFKSEEILHKNKIHYQFDLFSHVSHGFTVRGDLSIPEVKYAAEKALTDQVFWFQYHDKSHSNCNC